MLDLTRLRVLAAVARHGGVTAAAEALHYAQPSVSHHLARLEAETGTRLVQRVGRGVRLTPAGRLLAERAEEILGRLDAAETELAEHAGVRAGRVRLAAFPSALGSFVPVAAARFTTAHPGVELHFVEAEPPEALRQLRAGEVDVAVVFAYDTEPDGVRLTPLLVEPQFLVTAAPPDSTSDSADAPTADAAVPGGSARVLAAHVDSRWIAGCERCRQNLVDRCGDAGFTPRIAFTTDDYVAVQALVAAGLGVTVLPELTLRAHRHPGVRLTRLPGAHRRVFTATYGEPPDLPAPARLIEELVMATALEAR